MNLKKPIQLVTLVDTSGKVTGYSEKIEAHLRGELHLAFSLMIIRKRSKGTEYLLQRRAHDKYHSGGLWANTCCSHPMPNESVEAAARRRVDEELGIKGPLALSTIGQIYYRHALDNNMIEHEYDNVVVSEVDDIQWQKNPDEVVQIKWWTEDEILESLETQPDMFAAWFKEVFTYVHRHYSLAACAS